MHTFVLHKKNKTMSVVKKGDNIKVHYTGKLNDGSVFDSSEGREPLGFEVGAGMMIKGFDNGVEGMAVGEKKTIDIVAAEGYGERKEEMVVPFPKANFPADMKLEKGLQLTMQNTEGQPIPVTVAEVQEENVLLDANHFLAGKDLVFEVEIVEIS